MPLSAGDKLGHYEVLSLFGVGGRCEVYRATNAKLDRKVVIKALPSALARDPSRRRSGRWFCPASRSRRTTGNATGDALRVVTTHLKPGYLRKNGVPCSKDAVLTEYFNVHAAPYGPDWLIVTTTVHDPAYLVVDYITSTNFKREPNDAKWRPRPCTVQ